MQGMAQTQVPQDNEQADVSQCIVFFLVEQSVIVFAFYVCVMTAVTDLRIQRRVRRCHQ